MVAVSLTDTNERNRGPNLSCTKSILPSNKAFAMFKAMLSFFKTLLNLSFILLLKQSKISKLASLSVRENSLDSQISIVNANFSDVLEYVLPESIDAVTCNPPYFKYDKNSSLINDDEEKAIARHEITMTLEDIMVAAKYILKNKAPLYIVHRCDRLDEILSCLEKYNFKIKKLQFIYAGYDKEAIMVLVKATKNGKSGSLKVLPPINVLKHRTYKGIFE